MGGGELGRVEQVVAAVADELVVARPAAQDVPALVPRQPVGAAAINPGLYEKLAYDMQKDLAPVARLMLMGVIIALGPLAWVWLRNRDAEPARRLRAPQRT